ncbi:anaerobic ribonucleoside-triphosphate reductase activating protein [archaeon]|nr:anaerobic ribonucleoside-triphosphate reductase activating protein [archaeon]
MNVKGIQKFTLLDYPGKIACTLFLFGCNFRCGFCHNPELVLKDINPEISKKEILDFLKKRKNQIEGVCITGGEPLLTLEKDFLVEIKKLGYPIKLDTNGTFPKKLKEFIDDELIDYIAMDLKGSKENYSKIVCMPIEIKNIEESIKIIVNSNLDYEFRTTIIPKFHSKKEIESLGKWVNNLVDKKPKNYFLQGFKNMGKFIDSSYKEEKDTSEELLKELKETSKKYFENVKIRI